MIVAFLTGELDQVVISQARRSLDDGMRDFDGLVGQEEDRANGSIGDVGQTLREVDLGTKLDRLGELPDHLVEQLDMVLSQALRLSQKEVGDLP